MTLSPQRLFALSVAVAATACLLLLLATSAHAKSRSCGSVTVAGARYHVTVVQGKVKCKSAKGVLSDFLGGGGTMHGPKNGPDYKQYWTVRGWHCGHGAGGGGCNRHGRVIEAVWTANVG